MEMERWFEQAGVFVEFRGLARKGAEFARAEMNVFCGDEQIARYERIFEKEIHPAHYENFVRKMLEDPDYRKTYAAEGHWEESFSSLGKSASANNLCLKAISRLLSLKKPKARHYEALKTYGPDSFSGMSLAQLSRYVAAEDIEIAAFAFEEDSRKLEAVRWTARGLPAGYAIRKVQTDAELEEGAMRANA